MTLVQIKTHKYTKTERGYQIKEHFISILPYLTLIKSTSAGWLAQQAVAIHTGQKSVVNLSVCYLITYRPY